MSPGWDRVLTPLLEELDTAREEMWLVGGCVRDALLGMPAGDLDLVTAADPGAVAQRLHVRLGASVARLPRSVRAGVLSGSGDGAPLQVDISALDAGGIEDSLRERDFTINAMALPLSAWQTLRAAPERGRLPSDLLDPTGGYADLTLRLLRLAGPYAFHDDPGRVIRGARFIARFGLTPTDETFTLASDASPLLRELSADRLHDELNLLLAETRCADGIAFLERAGALRVLFPELREPKVSAHALDSLRWTARLQQPPRPEEALGFSRETQAGQWFAGSLPNGSPRVTALRWGLLLHALAPHDARAMRSRDQDERAISGFRRLPRGPERRIAYEIEARASFMARLIAYREPDERDLRRLFAIASEVTVDVLVGAVACADAQVAEGTLRDEEGRLVTERVRAILEMYFAEPARLIPPPLLTGRELIQELGIAPGPEIHRLLAEARGAQLDGRVATRAEALALVAELRVE